MPIQIEASDAPLTSDAGLLPLRQFDERIGLTKQLAAVLDAGQHLFAVRRTGNRKAVPFQVMSQEIARQVIVVHKEQGGLSDGHEAAFPGGKDVARVKRRQGVW